MPKGGKMKGWTDVAAKLKLQPYVKTKFGKCGGCVGFVAPNLFVKTDYTNFDRTMTASVDLVPKFVHPYRSETAKVWHPSEI